MSQDDNESKTEITSQTEVLLRHVLQKLRKEYCEPHHKDPKNHVQNENNSTPHMLKLIGMTEFQVHNEATLQRRSPCLSCV